MKKQEKADSYTLKEKQRREKAIIFNLILNVIALVLAITALIVRISR